jgi:dipeptidyl aminopeptidase/acylaminoacyl peptidase
MTWLSKMRIGKTKFHKVFFSVAIAAAALAVGTPAAPAQTQPRPRLTIDEFFNAVTFPAIEVSPDGGSVVIETERADWDQQIFRDDLWLYHENDGKSGASLIQLTQSGHDTEPHWSPDGRWIAFLSGRKISAAKSVDSDSDSDADTKEEPPKQIYLISPGGGEAFAVTRGDEEVHAFAWSADSGTIYFATRQPWTRTQKDDYKKDWKDVVQFRTAERGDTIFALSLAGALTRQAAAPAKVTPDSDKDEKEITTPGTQTIATIPLRIDNLIVSPDGRKLAFLTNAINQRQEKPEDVEIYTVDVARALLPAPAESESKPSEAAPTQPRRVTHNTAIESHPRWASDSRHIFFIVDVGSVSGPYLDVQPHLYWVDTQKPDTEKPDADTDAQWGKDFIGPVEHYAVATDSMLAAARVGTEAQIYSAQKPADSLQRLTHWPGTYTEISTSVRSPRVAFLYSSLEKPEEVYFSSSAAQLDQARAITQFNQLIAERDLPQGKPYHWKADDGTTIEGMLIYPPGKFESKNLPTLTLIHGGPEDADGNHFEADWYQWTALAATNGWLVFQPNYRGSTGYGDKFLMQDRFEIVSRPGKDILAGVDALVKEGIADPNRLTIGGYSYGGYMTNWLITQTTRFKAAVTGAGAVEHLANWGNDDTTYDDAYYLGGRPWEVPQRYHDEAAIFQIDKVRTPTHMVAGADDIRVAVLQDYLLERALYSLGIPSKLLIFPGEGHSLAKNPWHGKIKVREELKWLEKYGGG